jgi:lipopolysaccharide transport system ATP-binding protein
MGELAIRVTGLGKQYRLGAQQEQYAMLRDRVRQWASASLRTLLRRARRRERRPTFWALKDVSFEVNRGEVVGIIGRNGAGKSTLLKVLSRITEPTEGEVDIHGRVGSLLEVGTGFHPELTGRENVYLNGAILGMRRSEIGRKFDEIVSFAEVEKFIDTPVKFYSSGMYTRLAFAVAAHLEPEILIVDEVLAVGDAAFQKKCLGKMGDVAREGRTVLLVSHQMQAVQAITQRAILLNQGQLLDIGPTPQVVRQYLGFSRSEQKLSGLHQEGSGQAQFTALKLSTEAGEVGETIDRGTPILMDFEVELKELLTEANVSVSLRSGEGIELFSDSWCDQEDALLDLPAGTHRFRVTVPTVVLRPGPYWLTLCLAQRSGYIAAMVPGIELPPIVLNQCRRHNLEGNRWGVIYVACEWSKV